MKKLFAAIGILAFITLIGCQEPTITTKDTNNTLSVITTFPPLYSITANLVTDSTVINNLVPPGTSIHTWEPKPSDLVKISKADLLIINGLGIEEFLADIINSIDNPNLKIINTSENVILNKNFTLTELAEESEHEDANNEGDEHDPNAYDPHIWLSPNNGKVQAQNITKALISIDPSNSEVYQSKLSKYLAEITELQQKIQQEFSTATAKDFIVFHDAYQYFLAEFGLTKNRVAAIEPFPGKEPSPLYLQELVSLIKNKKVKTVFTEPQFSPKLVQALIKEAAINSQELNPIGSSLSKEDYLNTINKLANTILSSFSE